VADTPSADLAGIQDFADQLLALRTQLDSYETVVAVGDNGSHDVDEGLRIFAITERQSGTVIDTYLQALRTMALQSIAAIQAQDARPAQHLTHRLAD